MTNVTVTIDGMAHTVEAGRSVAAALLAAGQRAWRISQTGEPRGVFCGIGACFDCTLTVDGTANVRACLIPVRDGMTITTDVGLS